MARGAKSPPSPGEETRQTGVQSGSSASSNVLAAGDQGCSCSGSTTTATAQALQDQGSPAARAAGQTSDSGHREAPGRESSDEAEERENEDEGKEDSGVWLVNF